MSRNAVSLHWWQWLKFSIFEEVYLSVDRSRLVYFFPVAVLGTHLMIYSQGEPSPFFVRILSSNVHFFFSYAP